MGVAQHIAEQPAVLQAVARGVAARLSALPNLPSSPDRIVLVGVGSSMNALIAGAEALMRRTGAIIEFREPLAFLDFPPSIKGQPIVVAMSQGGRSATTVAAARLACELGLPTIAITADGDSDLAHTGAEIVVLPIGKETIGPKTKGYTASVLSLLVLADHLSGTSRESGALEVELVALLPQVQARVDGWMDRFGVPDFITICGRLGLAGTAMEAALKIVEMSGVPAVGLDMEEALHGRFHAHGPRSCAILLTRGGADLAMARHAMGVLAERGTPAVVCDLAGSGGCLGGDAVIWPRSPSAGWDVLWSIIPFQMLAVSLARRRGLVPEDMIYPGLGQALGTKLLT